MLSSILLAFAPLLKAVLPPLSLGPCPRARRRGEAARSVVRVPASPVR